MPKKIMIQTDTKPIVSVKNTNPQALQILMKEYDALREMYNQSVHNGQTMFNYYLTLMTAIFGGITFVSQPSSGVFLLRTTISFLLIFLAIIGSLYLSSLSTSFAHSARYARGVNELRKFMIESYDVLMPSIYVDFMAKKYQAKQSKLIFSLSLFIPVHTYQLFATIISSLSWASVVSFIYYSNNTSVALSEIVLRGILTFLVTYIIYSVYARFIYQLTISRANISIGN